MNYPALAAILVVFVGWLGYMWIEYHKLQDPDEMKRVLDKLPKRGG